LPSVLLYAAVLNVALLFNDTSHAVLDNPISGLFRGKFTSGDPA
jgi:hypothetical protein